MTSPSPDQQLRTAFSLHQAGRLPEAVALYRAVLAAEPANADALHLIGVALDQLGAHEQGRQFIALALREMPAAADFHNSYGTACRALGDLPAARDAYRQAVALQPRHAEAWNNLGALELAAAQPDAARAAFEAALAASPGDADAAYNLAALNWSLGQRIPAAFTQPLRQKPSLGTGLVRLAQEALAAGDVSAAGEAAALAGSAVGVTADIMVLRGAIAAAQGSQDAAEAAYRAALTADPNHIDGLKFLSKILVEAKRPREALPFLDRLAAFKSGDVTILHSLAQALLACGHAEAAAAVLDRALALKPDDLALRVDRAAAFRKLGRHAEARADFEAAAAAAPDNAEILGNLAGVETDAGDYVAAERIIMRALELDPDCGPALGNLAIVRNNQGRFSEAMELYRRAIAAMPENVNAHANYGLMLLRFGRLAEAWPQYAWRWREDDAAQDRGFGLPAWNGDPKAGGRLLLWREQGIGDELLYLGLLPELLALGADPALLCDPRLAPLLRRRFPGLAVFGAKEEIDPARLGLTCQAPVSDLARFLRPDTPQPRATDPYIAADPARVAILRGRYAALGGRRRIGISWRSRNPNQGEHKSLPLADWLPILRLPDTAFVSLQYGDCAAEITALAAQHGIQVHHDADIDPLTDLDGQAAQVAALDEVVSVSTAVVHVTGALGKKGRVLLPFERGLLWYWGDAGDSSPWHPTLRLYRPTKPGDWAELVAQCAADLAAESVP